MRELSKTPESISSEIVMKANTHRGWFLLVEGDFDLRFWKEKLNQDTIRPVACNGKTNLINAMTLLEQSDRSLFMARVCGLKDADFDRLLNVFPHPRVVYTDENDLETTLLLLKCTHPTQTYMERLLGINVDSEKRAAFERENNCSLVEHIRFIASRFGALRFLNDKHDWKIAFESISVLNNQWFSHSDLKFNITTLYQEFIKKLKEKEHFFSEVQLYDLIQSDIDQEWLSGWQLVQGHDLLTVFRSVTKAIGHQQVNESSLQNYFCLLHVHDLQTTHMVRELLSYLPESKRGHFFQA